MKQKEKELLLKDLSSRLFYNPWVQFNLEYGDNGHKEGLYKAHISSIDPTSGWLEVDYFETETLEKEWSSTIENVKPYLRPMSSMTEEEGKELEYIFCEIDAPCWVDTEYGCVNFAGGNDFIDTEIAEVYTDWLNKKMFDWRKLIEKGLALEAPKGMYE